MRSSFAFLGTAWSRAWGILLVGVWVAGMIQAVQLTRPDLAPLTFFGDLVLLFVATAAAGALYRIGIGPDHAGDRAFQVGPAGFNWGRLEWRVLGANIVVALTFFVLAIFVLFVWAIAFGVSAASQGFDAKSLNGSGGSQAQIQAFLHIMTGPAGVVSVIIAVPFVVGLALLGAKLALFAITAADTGGFQFGRAWSLTRGVLVPLIVATIVIFLAQFVAGSVAGFVAGVLAAATGHGAEGARVWGGVAGQLVGAALNAPLISGLQIFIYRAQRGDTNVAQTFA